MEQGVANISSAILEHNAQGIFALFSGGHDSLCSTHIASRHPDFTGVIHCNTGICACALGCLVDRWPIQANTMF